MDKKSSTFSDSVQRASAGAALHEIRSILETIPSKESFSFSKIQKWSRKQHITVPWPSTMQTSPDMWFHDQSFSMAPPSNVQVVGSFLLDTIIPDASDRIIVDLLVDMPKSVVDNADITDYRFFAIRSYYLARIAESLESAKGSEWSLMWTTFRGHVLKPILRVDISPTLSVHIHATASHLNRSLLAPHICNLSAKCLCALLASDSVKSTEEHSSTIYNSLILSDLVVVDLMKLIYAEIKKTPNLGKVIRMGKMWIQSNNYDRCAFHLNGFQFSVLVVHLYLTGVFGSISEPFFMFKTTMNYLASTDLINRSCVFPCKGSVPKSSSSLPCGSFEYSAAKLDIFFDWTIEQVLELQSDARRAFNMMTDASISSLDSILVHRDHLLFKCDVAYTIRELNWMPDVAVNVGHYTNEIVPDGPRLKLIARKVNQALNTRLSSTSAVVVHGIMPQPSSIHDNYARCVNEFEVGFCLDRNECYRLVERGPSADDVEKVRQFRFFWRHLVSTRKFKDGCVLAAVSFEHLAKQPSSSVIHAIMSFVFEIHFNVPSSEIQAVGGIDSSIDVCASLCSGFDEFAQSVRSLKNLALAVNRVELVDPLVAHASIDLMMVDSHYHSMLPRYLPVYNVHLHMESSNKWPDEYYGMQFSKQAFLASIAQELAKQTDVAVSMTSEFLDARVLDNVAVFRCRIVVPNEIVIMEKQRLDAAQVVVDFQDSPRHYRAVAALYGANSVFGSTCQWFKSWIARIGLWMQIPEQLLELLVASVFLDTHHAAPNTRLAALLRVFDLLLTFEWKQHALLVDFSSVDGCKERLKQSVASAFVKGVVPFWICTSYESIRANNRPIWCDQCKLSDDEFSYLMKHARDAVGLLVNGQMDLVSDMPQCDFIMRLDSTILRFRESLGKSCRKELNLIQEFSSECSSSNASRELAAAMPGFDPALMLVNDIQQIFKDESLGSIYYDPFGSSGFIGICVTEKTAIEAVRSRIQKLAGDLLA